MIIKIKCGNVKIRKAKFDDIDPIAENMRASDRLEIRRSHDEEPVDALERAFDDSVYKFTVLHKNKPMAMFGVTPYFLTNENNRHVVNSCIWLLGTDDIEKHWLSFAKLSKAVIKIVTEDSGLRVYNWVDVDNTTSISWLKFLGAEFQPPKEFGVQNLPFQFFTLGAN